MAHPSRKQEISTALLTHVIHAPGIEDAHTELFAELLRINELADAFTKELLGFQMERATLEEQKVETQWQNIEGSGRPDVAIRAPGHFVLVENKLEAGLTKNQPGGYLEELASWKSSHESGMAVLCLQVPASRLESIARKVWEALKLPLDTGVAAEAERVGIRLITWQQTAAVFSGVALSNPVAAYLRDCFLELIPTLVVRTPLELNEERLKMIEDLAVQNAVIALQDTLSQLRRKVGERGYKPPGQPGGTATFSYQGFTLRRADNMGWLGIFWQGAAYYKCSPLFLYLHNLYPHDACLEAVRAQQFDCHDTQAFPNWDGTAIPLKINTSLDFDEQVEQLLDQIDQITSLVW
jgi:hypothetical protein